MRTDDEMQRYYERDRERDRLASGLGIIEFARTVELIERTLPAAPAVVADIGGGPGRYTDLLVERGYRVIHRDPVAHHVDQVRDRHGTEVDTAVGDARELDLEDGSVDAVLLLGPLYHLPDGQDRALVMREAARVLRPGGMVYGAAISRWAPRLNGMLAEHGYRDYPQLVEMVDEVERTGVLPPAIEGGFTGFTHTPDQLRDETVATAGLDLVDVLAIEGVASVFGDVDERLADDTDRTVLFDSIRALEAVPDLMGGSAHLLAILRRS